MIAKTILAAVLSAITIRAQPQTPPPSVDVRKTVDQEKADAQAFITATLARLANEDRKAAEQGDAHAQSSLGFRYNHGLGVKQDYVEAASWYRKAAEQGDADAQTNLGFMYGAGQGVTQDYAEAARWYRKAAEQGDLDAQLKLGIMYGVGQRVYQEYVEEAVWYIKAAYPGSARYNGPFTLARAG
jgi:TPR repeat protein